MLYSSGGFSVAAQTVNLWYLLPLLGGFSALAMSLTMVASSKLPVSLFGTLSYLEPVFLFVLSITVLSQSLEEGGSLFMYAMIVTALSVMIADSALSYLNRRREDRLHGYNEPQINSFPSRQRLKNRRIEGILKARRFRKIKRYQNKIDKMSRKLDKLYSK